MNGFEQLPLEETPNSVHANWDVASTPLHQGGTAHNGHLMESEEDVYNVEGNVNGSRSHRSSRVIHSDGAGFVIRGGGMGEKNAKCIICVGAFLMFFFGIVFFVVLMKLMGYQIAPQPDFQEYSPLIIVGIDGFRASYLKRGISPHIQSIIDGGAGTDRMEPSFPSKTFPNFYAIATGLYPESHGIVSNYFFDPKWGEFFTMGDGGKDGRWWGGEPVWATAVSHGIHAGVYFWPGNEAEIGGRRPTYFERFNSSVPSEDRAKKVLEWIDFPKQARPELLMTYIEVVDHQGHKFGPESEEVNEAIREADDAVGVLLKGLERRGLAMGEKSTVVVVADHGFAATPVEKAVALEKYIDLKKVTITSTGPEADVWPFPPGAPPPEGGEGSDTVRLELVANLTKMAESVPQATLRTRGTWPERFHYSNSHRIAPVSVQMRLNWTVTTTEEERKKTIKGNHGWDNADPLMGALFGASGPRIKKGVRVAPFENVQLYSFFCNILGLTPAPSNTTGILDAILIPAAPPATAPNGLASSVAGETHKRLKTREGANRRHRKR
uniref:Sulfatase N-terminal domain-containing protein n=1 Tax=Chromera velia CCMP2878 TaxID=1169474 RepID=A0A0G4EZ66_9ALVE|eukprot:Cvel_14289.t1-p1 / transcript=Cvel_14289.t1 / gene=Cvel_14289 / organism=Chromera_velia_CCMP2878 / gene_product=Uncharacterized pyrophosphatase/phosphodiesterase, putative / transcript_product=Uncharacterized pyrophosphatase/phosphodiesterase, putative / location=Cvel_scaffold1009:20484-25126(-) / protein_length=551 / sequence_SO=supercontig / SO=protein_coding / is_pseudo=false